MLGKLLFRRIAHKIAHKADFEHKKTLETSMISRVLVMCGKQDLNCPE